VRRGSGPAAEKHLNLLSCGPWFWRPRPSVESTVFTLVSRGGSWCYNSRKVSLAKRCAAVISIGLLLSNIVELYSFIVIFWCLLSWFPNIRWYDQPWKTLDRIVQPVVTPLRKVLPPINGIDLSPMIAMALLQAIGMLIRNTIP